jgi:hypothetical protein
MRPLSAAELLQVYDETTGMSLIEKALRLLGKACEMEDWKQLGNLSIGNRDAKLLQLREWMFGDKLKNMATCPACSEMIEWEASTEDLHLQPVKQDEFVETFSLLQDGFNIHFRLPDSYDVLKFSAEENQAFHINQLLTECIIDITGADNEKYAPDVLPALSWQALEESMSKQDPQADINMQIICPHCQHNWNSVFDIMNFLWAEINNWAKHIMQEVALLARAFSWSEKDILAMSPQRRQSYIKMIYQ